MVFQGDGLLFVGAKAQLLQKDWLKLHASDMAELIKYDIHKSDLNYTYELLITSIDSDSILGLFEDEYKYVINIFKSES
jgi:hypothetical protein